MFKKEKIKDLHYSVTGVLPAAETQKMANEILKEHGAKAKIAGFRPGHVPMDILRARYGKGAWADAVDKLMNADMDAFVRDKKIKLAGAPRADVIKVALGEDTEYSLEFDVLPTLPHLDLEKFTIVKKTAAVPESEIVKSLENLRKSRAQAEKQPADYRAAIGDVAVIDFKGFVGNEAFAGGEAKHHHLILGSGSFIPGFEEKLIGRKVGEKFDITVKFPKDYHAAELAGKDARFQVEIHELRHHLLPELNDQLAKDVGLTDLAALRDHIKKILEEQYMEASARDMRNELLDILADKVKLDLPENLVAQEYDMARAEFDEHAGHAHAKDQKWDDKKERKEAERRVKLGLILAEWGEQNGIGVENGDIQRAVWAEASRYPDPQQVFAYYNQNPNALSMMRGMLFEQKALDAMITHTKTKEKTVKPEELFKQTDVK